MRNLLHNYHCYFGTTDHGTQKMEQAVQFTKKMLCEMSGCPECFLHANNKDAKDDQSWFLEACKPPHLLCTAKHKGSNNNINKMSYIKVVNFPAVGELNH